MKWRQLVSIKPLKHCFDRKMISYQSYRTRHSAGSYLWLPGTGDSLKDGKPWPPVFNGVLLTPPPGLSLGGPVSGVWRVSVVLGLDVLVFPFSPFHCWPRCGITSSPLWSMPTFISSNFWMDLDKNNLFVSSTQHLGCVSFIKSHNRTPSPAQEGLCEVVLGSVLWLHPALQQHLLVKLSLLLLLLQMLLHAETLPVILLDVFRGVKALDRHTCTQWTQPWFRESCGLQANSVLFSTRFVLPELLLHPEWHNIYYCLSVIPAVLTATTHTHARAHTLVFNRQTLSKEPLLTTRQLPRPRPPSSIP